mgnify:CR=1 FL=1
MGGAVTGNKPRAIHGKKNIKLHQIDIVDDLIIGALEEGRIDRNDRQQALTGKTCRKADGMLLRHTDIKEAAGMAVLEEVEAGAVLHGGGDAAQTRFVIARSASAQPKVEEKESFGESSGLVRWLRSMDDTA